MSDIVDEMKNWRDKRGYPTPGEMLDRAIAEITRLRAEVARLAALEAPERTPPATWQDECVDVEAAFARSGVRPKWPDDEPGNIGPMAAAMADEIARLRLTDAEREAIDNAARWLIAIQSADDDAAGAGDPRAGDCAATLLGFLVRHGGER